MIKNLLSSDAVILNLKAKTKKEALNEIATHLEKNKFVSSAKDFEAGLIAREKQFSTGIGESIAIPHAQNKSVLKNVVLIARSKDGID